MINNLNVTIFKLDFVRLTNYAFGFRLIIKKTRSNVSENSNFLIESYRSFALFGDSEIIKSVDRHENLYIYVEISEYFMLRTNGFQTAL